MSPIIEIQRRMVEAGRIRAGEKGDKGEPRKLTNWRLTSKDRVRLDEAARLWGGEVREWAERPGEFELYTTTASLPIMLLPGHLPSTWYELWSKGGCQRRCDGVHEIMSDSACLCGEERECKPYTRLSVLLPDLPGIGSWLLSSTGWNAAAELAGAADLLQRGSAQGVLIPADLRLEQRTSVQGGQTRKFAVPVIDIRTTFRELLGAPAEKAALPAGYTPIAAGTGNGVSLEEGLKAAETQEPKRTARSAPLIPEDDIPFGDEPTLDSEQPGAPPSPDAAPPAALREAPQAPLTDDERKQKLNALVGQLRGSGAITTEQLYAAIAKGREVDAAELPTGASGARRWSILRDCLTSDELANLHGRLGRLWATTQGDAA
jgi:hypothetical protein